ncbi:MAG: dienelactone hydrolase family protein [Chloroflexota bacterium]
MAVIRTEKVDLKVNGAGAWGYLAQPDDSALHPGVVLIQEWWGIEPHIQDLAQKLAVEGFVVLVPDLYHGKIATEPDDAQKLMMATVQNLERVFKEISYALDYVKALPNVGPKKLGLIGFCMGGLVTWELASQYPDLGAIVPFYGVMYEPTPEKAAKINAPVLAIYGEADAYVSPEQRAKIAQVMQEAGRNLQIEVYPAGHAFINPDHGAWHEASAQKAWPQALNFLKENLK